MAFSRRAPLKPFSRGRSIRLKLKLERPEIPGGPAGKRLLVLVKAMEFIVRTRSMKFWSKEAMRKQGMKNV